MEPAIQAGNRPSTWGRKARRWLLIATVIYCGYLAVLFCVQRQLLFPGTAIKVGPQPPVAAGLEQIFLETPHGRIETLFLPPLVSTNGGERPCLIFAHGNGEVVDDWITALDGFRERGFGVLLVEYPGYGRSSGSPSEGSIREAMAAGYDWLAKNPRTDASCIVGFGDSLGGGAICALSRERKLRALILHSTFPSLSMFAPRYLAPAFLIRDNFDNIGALKLFSGPVLVTHGRHDRLIPWPQAKRLAAAAKQATFKLYDSGHGSWLPDQMPIWPDIDEFLAGAGIHVAPPTRHHVSLLIHLVDPGINPMRYSTGLFRADVVARTLQIAADMLGARA